MNVSTATASRGPTSEDRVFTTARGDEIAIVVADGAGGRTGGAAAADAFRQAAEAWLERSRDWFDVRALSDVFAEVDARIVGEGETTAVVVIVSPHAVAGVSAGDSEAWMVRDGRVDDLTAKQSRARIGSGRASPVMFHRRALDGVLVVATDGLFKHAGRAAIARACDSAESLVLLPRLPSGEYPDDVSVAVVR